VTAQAAYYREELGLTVKTVAVTDRSGIKMTETGFSPDELAEFVTAKASGAKLVYHRVPRTRDNWAALKEKVWPLPLHTPILVDVTAADTAPLFMEALEHGFHVVTANKKPLAVPQEMYDEMFRMAREQGLSIRYEATVGAGLPVLDTLSKLQEAGDQVDTILGCLSGTLGYLMTQLEEGTAFSTAVTTAHAMGYTEPDPREDLSGMDVARKALILARTLGLRANIEEIALEPLFPKELSDADPKKFMKKLAALDADYAGRVARARKQQKVLRYVARISRKGITVGLETVPNTSPMARLHGTDNQVVIHTARYSANPLVVTGPGAGADVTASGVLNDIVAIASHADRRAAPRLPALKRKPAKPRV
jgi:aspartokinase/homoserine dehydrogenase 1